MMDAILVTVSVAFAIAVLAWFTVLPAIGLLWVVGALAS